MKNISLTQWFPTTATGTTIAPRAFSKCSPKILKYPTCYAEKGSFTLDMSGYPTILLLGVTFERLGNTGLTISFKNAFGSQTYPSQEVDFIRQILGTTPSCILCDICVYALNNFYNVFLMLPSPLWMDL